MSFIFAPRSFKLAHKLLLPIIAVNLLSSAAFTGYLYQQQKRSVMSGIDRQLTTAAYGLKLQADAFHDRLSTAPPDPKEYLELLGRLSEYATQGHLKYLYTTVQKDGKIVFTLSSYTKEELEKGSYTKLYDAYADASAGLKAAFADGKPHFDEYQDQWGSFRSVFVPCRSPKGVSYVLGADVSLAEVGSLLRGTLYGCLAIGAAIFAAVTAIVLMLVHSIAGAVRRLADGVNRIAGGDLGVTIAHDSGDELGLLAADMNEMVATLRSVVGNVQGVAERVSGASLQLSDTSAALESVAERTVDQVLGLASAGEEMASTSGEISDNCGEVASSAHGALAAARAGASVVDATVGVMQRIAERVRGTSQTVENLGERSNQIGTIVGTIEDIADQTNLLALNAAIEAARAGDQGRGFAVVADEVRALAERTAKSTREITSMIHRIQQETRQAVASMVEGVEEVEQGTAEATRSGEALRDIVERIGAVEVQVAQIATAAEEQTATTNEISENLHRITDLVQGTNRSAHDSAGAAGELRGLAEDLRMAVGSFKLVG